MPANTTPIFTLTPRIGIGQITVPDAAMDAPTNYAAVITGATFGTKIERVRIQFTTGRDLGNMMVRLFIYDGVNTRLLEEFLIADILPSYGVRSAFYEKAYPDLILPSGYALRATADDGAQTDPDRPVISATINNAGSGYLALDTLIILGGNNDATIEATTVDGSGALTSITLLNPGTGYLSSTDIAVSGGSGAGATVDITATPAPNVINVIAFAGDF